MVKQGEVRVDIYYADFEAGVSNGFEAYVDSEEEAVKFVNFLNTLPDTYAEAFVWDDAYRGYIIPAQSEAEKEMYVG